MNSLQQDLTILFDKFDMACHNVHSIQNLFILFCETLDIQLKYTFPSKAKLFFYLNMSFIYSPLNPLNACPTLDLS